MYCTLRQYDGCTDVASFKEQVEKLLPTIREMPGFTSYLLIDGGDNDVTSISTFETKAQADAANEQVAGIISKDSALSALLPTEPLVQVGEILIDNRK